MSKENRKQAVSIRMSGADIGKVKRLAERLGVRDSDVIRYAVKTMLARLAPLYDPHVRGRSLVPVFVEAGSDLFLHFELDAMRLDGIINDDAEEGRKVDHEDLQLIAMSGTQQSAARWPLHAVSVKVPPPRMSVGAAGEHNGYAGERASDQSSTSSLREYLYGKYMQRTRSEA